jgi:hypothetical protein
MSGKTESCVARLGERAERSFLGTGLSDWGEHVCVCLGRDQASEGRVRATGLARSGCIRSNTNVAAFCSGNVRNSERTPNSSKTDFIMFALRHHDDVN